MRLNDKEEKDLLVKIFNPTLTLADQISALKQYRMKGINKAKWALLQRIEKEAIEEELHKNSSLRNFITLIKKMREGFPTKK